MDRYQEAIERAKQIKEKILDSHLSNESREAVSKYINELIPELAESEDERIRKEAISIVQSYMNICDEEGDPCLSGYKVLAWLEKHKETETIVADYDEHYDLSRNAMGMINIGACYINNRSRKEVLEWLEDVPRIIRQLSAKVKKLEKQKPQVNIDHFKSVMLHFLQDAANRKDDSEIEADLEVYAEKLLNLVGAAQTNEAGPIEFTLTLRNCLVADTELTEEQADTFADAYGKELFDVARGVIKSGLDEGDIREYKNRIGLR